MKATDHIGFETVGGERFCFDCVGPTAGLPHIQRGGRAASTADPRDPRRRNSMSAHTLARPTTAEVDAVEKVLAEAHGCQADGYYRAVAEACIEAANDARLREFIAECGEDARAYVPGNLSPVVVAQVKSLDAALDMARREAGR